MTVLLTPEQFAYIRAQVVERLNTLVANAMPYRNATHRTALMETTAIYPTRQGCYRVFHNCGKCGGAWG